MILFCIASLAAAGLYAIFLLSWTHMLNGQLHDRISLLANQLEAIEKQQMNFSHMLKKQNDQIIKQLTKK